MEHSFSKHKNTDYNGDEEVSGSTKINTSNIASLSTLPSTQTSKDDPPPPLRSSISLCEKNVGGTLCTNIS